MNWELYFVQGIELLFLGIGSYFDIKNRELPTAFLLIFGIMGLFCNWAWRYQSRKNLMLGIAIGIFFLMVCYMTKEAMGYGDGLGLCVLGILKGWEGMIPVVFCAFLLSGVFGIWRILGLKEKAEITVPFFPFLFLAWIGVMVL